MAYLDFEQAFDKVDHEVPLHKIKILGTTETYHSPVISGVRQGTVLGLRFFIIPMCDINSGITFYSMVSFADDTRLYYGISNVDDCAILQNDLNSIYEWASGNNNVP